MHGREEGGNNEELPRRSTGEARSKRGLEAKGDSRVDRDVRLHRVAARGGKHEARVEVPNQRSNQKEV